MQLLEILRRGYQCIHKTSMVTSPSVPDERVCDVCKILYMRNGENGLSMIGVDANIRSLRGLLVDRLENKVGDDGTWMVG